MATQGPSITSSLQDTFHRIETLGNPGGGSYRFPPPPSSRVTDSVIGTNHDFHAIRGPPMATLEEGSVATGGSGSVGKSKRNYIIGIVIVSILLVAIGVAIFFLRRRNDKRVKDEQEAEQKAEEQFKEDMLRKMNDEAQRAASIAAAAEAQAKAQAQEQPQRAIPTPPVSAVPTTRTLMPVSVPPPPLPKPQQAPVSVVAPVAPRVTPDHDQEIEAAVAQTLDTRKRQEQAAAAAAAASAAAEADAAEALQKRKWLEQLEAAEAVEAAEKRKRQEQLEALRNRFSSGINNVVTTISDQVSKTIASQRAFSAHSSHQEFDEKVLLDTGNPSISTAPLDDSELPSIGLLNVELDAHPDPAAVAVDLD